MLELVGDVGGLLELDAFRFGLLGAVRTAVPADWVSLNDVGDDPSQTWGIVEPAMSPAEHETFARLAMENPLARRFAETQDGRPLRFSDVGTAAERRSTRLYREFYGPIGLEHQLAFTLPATSGRVLGVALSRRERDFDDTERDLLLVARPHLIQAYRTAIEYSEVVARLAGSGRSREDRPVDLRTLGLTGREAEVLRAAMTGRHDADIAADLGISLRTVQKHLQRSYRKLGVGDRAGAARRVAALAAESSGVSR